MLPVLNSRSSNTSRRVDLDLESSTSSSDNSRPNSLMGRRNLVILPLGITENSSELGLLYYY